MGGAVVMMKAVYTVAPGTVPAVRPKQFFHYHSRVVAGQQQRTLIDQKGQFPIIGKGCIIFQQMIYRSAGLNSFPKSILNRSAIRWLIDRLKRMADHATALASQGEI